MDLARRRLYVRNVFTEDEQFASKSGNERPVPLRGSALETLRAMYSGRSGRVFLAPDGAPPKPDRVTKRFKFYVRKAMLPQRERLKLHCTRHTTAA